MFGFNSVDDIVDAKAFKRPVRKPLPPLKTSGGTILEDMEENRLPGTYLPAVIENANRDDPWRGKRCGIRKCREGAQYKILDRLPDEDDVPPQDYVPSDNPLVIQLEAAVHNARPAVMIETGEPVFLCVKHYSEFMDARNARVVQEREARQEPSWALHDLDYGPGAKIELIPGDSKHFRVTDAQGRSMRLEIVMHFAECQARIEGREWRQEVLSPEQRRQFLLAVKFPNGDIPEAARIAKTYSMIAG
jgi:hypothetical protein